MIKKRYISYFIVLNIAMFSLWSVSLTLLFNYNKKTSPTHFEVSETIPENINYKKLYEVNKKENIDFNNIYLNNIEKEYKNLKNINTDSEKEQATNTIKKNIACLIYKNPKLSMEEIADILASHHLKTTIENNIFKYEYIFLLIDKTEPILFFDGLYAKRMCEII